MDKNQKLLLVEDEQIILDGLIDLFSFHGFEVESATDGRVGLEMALSNSYDLIILDVMLPSIDGFQVCNEIRSSSRSQPIIMLTAKNTEEDIINGLTLGADDYMSKPFSVRELVLRVEALLRRSDKMRSEDDTIQIGSELTIDANNLVGVLTQSPDEEKKLSFTRREVEILRYLQTNSNRPVPRGELLSEVWGYQKADSVETRTVDIHIAKLRKKVEYNVKDPKILVTIRGEGYKLVG